MTQQYIRVRDGALVDEHEALDGTTIRPGYGIRQPLRFADSSTGDGFRRLSDSELAAHRPGYRLPPPETLTGDAADAAAHLLRQSRDLREQAYADYQQDLIGRYKDADPSSIVGASEQAGAASGGPVGSACMVTSYRYRDQFAEPGTLQWGLDDSGRRGLVCVPNSLASNDASPKERAYADYDAMITSQWQDGNKKRKPDPDEIETNNLDDGKGVVSTPLPKSGLADARRSHAEKMAAIYDELDHREEWR